jgi:hypothetical protein
VTEETQSGRSNRNRRRPYYVWMVQGGRSRVVGVSVALLLVGALAGYVFGRLMYQHVITEARELSQQVQAESQKLKGEMAGQTVNIATLQAKLTSVQATLEAIVPSENTYNISPNQSLIVADGHLTIALIGSPTNESVNININGKQQSVFAGQVIQVASDPSTSCQVAVQSFDMFKAVLTATCAVAKHQ